MSRRALPLLVLGMLLAATPVSRADFTFHVHQDLGALNGQTPAFGPFYLVWQFNNLNDANNSVRIDHFSYDPSALTLGSATLNISDPAHLYDSGATTPVPITPNNTPTTVGNPFYQYYNPYGAVSPAIGISDVVQGSVTTAGVGPANPPIPTVYLFEDNSAGYAGQGYYITQAVQEFTVANASASIDFDVTITNNYDINDPTFGFPAPPDSFQFSINYFNNPIPPALAAYTGDPQISTGMVTTNPALSDAFVYVDIYSNTNFQSVQSGTIVDKIGNPASIEAIILASGLAFGTAVNPEPGTMMIWGITLAGLGGYCYRRRKQMPLAVAV